MESKSKYQRPRACDLCRKKKVRCDAPENTGRTCSNCVTLGTTCTYVSRSERRGPTKRYTASLENRVQQMQKLLEKHASKAELAKELGFTVEVEESDAESPETSFAPLTMEENAMPTPWEPADLAHCIDIWHLPAVGAEESPDSETEPPDDVDERPFANIPDFSSRFHGKSSGLGLLRTAHQMKRAYDGSIFRDPGFAKRWEHGDWYKGIFEDETNLAMNAQFPPPDLMRSLVDIFFRYVTPFLPIIHRPTFEANLAKRSHEQDSHYAQLVLMVCAVAASYSEDPRVTAQSERGTMAPGYQYFDQAKDWNRSLAPARLTDLQTYFLMSLYRQSIGDPHASWIDLGVGIRFAEDVGAHRKNNPRYLNSPTEAEQWKRIFWCYVTLDRFVSSSLGKALAVHEEDIDIELPAPLPEESKEERENIQFFNTALRLGSLISVALRTIYSVRPKLRAMFGPNSEATIVTQLDHALEKWLKSVPEHLRWDPLRENDVHFEQSVDLYSTYYYCIIIIHRPFIGAKGKVSKDHLRSLEVCTKAAQSCGRVVAALGRRSGLLAPHIRVTAFTSAVVLLTYIWGIRKYNTGEDVAPLLRDVQECVFSLRCVEHRWPTAGRLVDILRDLAGFGDIPFPETPEESTPAASSGIPTPPEPHLAQVDGLLSASDSSRGIRISDSSPHSFHSGPMIPENRIADELLPISPSWATDPNGDFRALQLSQDIFGDTDMDPTSSNFLGTWSATSGEQEWEDWGAYLANVNLLSGVTSQPAVPYDDMSLQPGVVPSGSPERMKHYRTFSSLS